MAQAKPRPWTEAQFMRRHANEEDGGMFLDRATCDWVIDVRRDTAICRVHGEVCDGVDSKHFPGNSRKETA